VVEETVEIRGTKWNDLNGNGERDTGSINGNPPDLVFVLDVSGSTSSPFQGSEVGDVNNDGNVNTILDAEIAAFQNLNQALIDAGLGQTARVGIVAFSDSAQTVGTVTNPAADSDGDGISNVRESLSSLQIGGGTDYETGLQEAQNIFESLNTAAGNGNLVFLSDGEPNSQTYEDEVASLKALGVNLLAFGAGEGAALQPLQLIDPAASIFTSTDDFLSVFRGLGASTGTPQFREPGLGGVTVYLDLNNNGALDSGEPNTVTLNDDPATPNVSEAGQYQFTGLSAGTYTVREVVPAGLAQTFPTGGAHTVTVAAGQTVEGIDFGNQSPQTSGVLLEFEGIGDLNYVNNFYASRGVTFSSNAVALVDSDAGGSGNFGGEPSPNTVMAYAKGDSITMNLNQTQTIASGVISFDYTSPNETHEVKIYDGLNGTGNLLASATLGKTPSFGAPDTEGEFSPLVPFTVNFAGNAKSVVMGSHKYEIGFDDIRINLVPVTGQTPNPTPGQALTGTSNPDSLTGGAGNDTIAGLAGSDTLIGSDGNDILQGNEDGDFLFGNAGEDSFNGGKGDDNLAGGAGNDSLTGDDGNDTLTGGAGNDTLTGSAGSDSFAFNNLSHGADTIADFVTGTDRILIEAAGFGGGLTAGALSSNQFVSGTAALDADDRFIYSAGSLFYDADGTGTTAQVQIATLTGAPALNAADILIS